MSKNENKGWICPKCNRVYAPWIDKCQYCGSSTITYTYTPPTCPYQWWCNTPIYTTTTTPLNSDGINDTISTANININSKLTNEVKG